MSLELIGSFKQQLLEIGFKGDICLDTPTRLLNATDNSIYEVMPLAVIQPRDANDIGLLLQVSNLVEYQSLNFCARGGGTDHDLCKPLQP